MRFGCRKLVFQHVLNLVFAFDRFDIPRKGDKVAPIAIVCEHLARAGDVAAFQRIPECVKKRLRCVGQCRVEHYFLPEFLWFCGFVA
jgi:hypothetical protein